MKHALQYGLFIGFAYMALSLLMFALDWDTSPFLRNLNSLSIIFISVGIYSGIKARSEQVQESSLAYSEAFKTGVIISVFSGLIAGCFSYIYFLQIHPGLAEIIIQQKIGMMRNTGILEEKILRHTNWMTKEFSPEGQFIFNFGGFLVLGTIFSVIFSFFHSEKKSG